MNQFSIPDLSIKDKEAFLKLNKEKATKLLLNKYGLTKKDIGSKYLY